MFLEGYLLALGFLVVLSVTCYFKVNAFLSYLKKYYAHRVVEAGGPRSILSSSKWSFYAFARWLYSKNRRHEDGLLGNKITSLRILLAIALVSYLIMLSSLFLIAALGCTQSAF